MPLVLEGNQTIEKSKLLLDCLFPKERAGFELTFYSHSCKHGSYHYTINPSHSTDLFL